jgi:hypothetical protein
MRVELTVLVSSQPAPSSENEKLEVIEGVRVFPGVHPVFHLPDFELDRSPNHAILKSIMKFDFKIGLG